MMQAKEEVFEAAKMAYTLYGWLLQEVATEVGWETAFRAQSRIGDRLAGLYEPMFEQKSAGAELGVGAIAEALGDCYRHFGSDHEIVAQGDTVAFHTARCPVYEGLKASGLDHAIIEKVCSVGTARSAELLHERFPGLTARLKFREQGNQPCLEEFVLAK